MMFIPFNCWYLNSNLRSSNCHNASAGAEAHGNFKFVNPCLGLRRCSAEFSWFDVCFKTYWEPWQRSYTKVMKESSVVSNSFNAFGRNHSYSDLYASQRQKHVDFLSGKQMMHVSASSMHFAALVSNQEFCKSY